MKVKAILIKKIYYFDCWLQKFRVLSPDQEKIAKINIKKSYLLYYNEIRAFHGVQGRY
jgi:hypothetical protein